ncbi:MAG TPA: hypothetical protein DEG69_16980, partial [Flavobacteriaceae bacterium]|nr:hypothetical protein [Flavobacteriaceae bacterium]
MKINGSEDLINLVPICSGLMDFINIKMLMQLRTVLNRGCKCNKKKKQKQLENVYEVAINKYKDNESFNNLILNYMKENDISEISFSA